MNRKLLLLLLVFSGFCNSVFSNHTTSNLIFTAKMSGASEVPAVVTDGQGLAIITFNEDRSTLYFDVSLSNLTGPLTGIHIHEGEVGENGPVIYNLTSFLQGSRLKGSISGISRTSLAKFFSGDYYINAHTELNPGGEIRGQIFLEADQRFTARLTGDEEVPAVATDGKGLMIANLSHAGHLVDLHMVFAGLSSPVVGAHIHHAPAGTNGGVIFDLGPFIFGHLVIGTWDPTGYLDALRAGELYVNIHTVNNPGGEIRGQLLLEDGLLFDAVLNGDQEVPVIDTDARGVGLFNVSEDLSTLEYFVIFDSLSGDADQAHFHLGAEGRNGGVVIDLTDDIDGNIIRGSTPLSFDIFNALLDGQIYINVHTEENPGGEIRGQVYALARQGYIFDMSGGQEVPAVTTSGTGLGMVSINGSQTNAHYMVHFSNLDGEFTSSHFHHGEPGVSGPVIHDVTGSFNEFGSADDYWITGFTDATARMIREGEVYLNVHSDLYPAGEIRGNLIGVDRI